MFTIRKCCGTTFTIAAHHGWAKVLSRMLDIIVPVVIRYELEEEDKVLEIVAKRGGLSQRSAHSASPWTTGGEEAMDDDDNTNCCEGETAKSVMSKDQLRCVLGSLDATVKETGGHCPMK